MKIGLNATCFNERPSGAKQRFTGIYSELARRMPDAEFVLYEPEDCRVGEWFDGVSNLTVRRTPIPSTGRTRKFIRGLGYWRPALKPERFDLFEGFNLPHFDVPNAHTFVTIHDIRRLRPNTAVFDRLSFKATFERALKTVGQVITVSEAMKAEILGFYPNAPVSVVYNGVDAGDFDAITQQELSAFRQKHALPEAFILAVGHFEERKNYRRLIEALALLRDRGNPCSLLIIGNDSGLRTSIEAHIESAKLRDQVKILSGIDDSEVRCAYKLCNLFVFPSCYEGFGIPILEAMAAGRPMVLSDIPVFREITEQQGVYFPCCDIEAMAAAIDHALSSSDEQARLVEYGNRRVQAFSFQCLAEQMANRYRTLL